VIAAYDDGDQPKQVVVYPKIVQPPITVIIAGSERFHACISSQVRKSAMSGFVRFRSCLSAIELGFLCGFERRREVPLGRNSTSGRFAGRLTSTKTLIRERLRIGILLIVIRLPWRGVAQSQCRCRAGA
jgi:hypothetical protein